MAGTPFVYHWRIPALIPNKAGFRLVAQLHNGFELVTEVVVDEKKGMHWLRDIPINRVKRWRHAFYGDFDKGMFYNTYVLAEEEAGRRPDELLADR